jgi:hypothetical protein
VAVVAGIAIAIVVGAIADPRVGIIAGGLLGAVAGMAVPTSSPPGQDEPPPVEPLP